MHQGDREVSQHMVRYNRRTISRSIVGLALAMGGSARAEMQNVATVLDFAGFDLIGQRNPLSGGIDFLATNNFDGAPFDFGAWDLSLGGPLSLQVSTGGRFLSQFDVSLTTAVNGSTNATPLSYAFNSDIGAQSSQISGTVLADVDFSLNGLGFYDLSVTYSSRQSVTNEGLLANDGKTNDFDLGPINVSGNLYADVLAFLTEPIFDRAGRANPFERFSGRSQISEILQASATDLQTALADGNDPKAAASSRTRYDAFRNYGLVSTSAGATVPEPAVLVLMLLGVPAIVLRRSTRLVSRTDDPTHKGYPRRRSIPDSSLGC